MSSTGLNKSSKIDVQKIASVMNALEKPVECFYQVEGTRVHCTGT